MVSMQGEVYLYVPVTISTLDNNDDDDFNSVTNASGLGYIQQKRQKTGRITPLNAQSFKTGNLLHLLWYTSNIPSPLRPFPCPIRDSSSSRALRPPAPSL